MTMFLGGNNCVRFASGFGDDRRSGFGDFMLRTGHSAAFWEGEAGVLKIPAFTMVLVR